MHGSTLHNLQAFDNARRHEPTTYYSRSGPVGQVFTHALATSPTANIGVVGLGTGAMSCLGNSDQNWTYFELDPHILKLARDSGLFTFLETCAPRARFVIGDGRRTLEQEPDGRFDIVAVDVFSSDSIPVHMLTREAIQTYGRVLKADGILLLHISNRYLNLAGPIAATLTSLGWRLRLQRHRPNEEDALLITPSEWIVAARGGDVFDRVVSDARWTTIEVLPGTRPWTDSFSNLISTLR
jgi:SAM-dependent methyltransferase